MATCGDIDGKPCEYHYTPSCPADRVDWHPSKTHPVCKPVAALLECRRHLHACQLTVDSVHKMLGTDSASDLEAEVRELLRCRVELDQARALIAELEDTIDDMEEAKAALGEENNRLETLHDEQYMRAEQAEAERDAERENTDAARLATSREIEMSVGLEKEIRQLKLERDEAVSDNMDAINGLDNAQASIAELEAERDRLREFADRMYEWADGFANRRSGMGSGLHAETWPSLCPSAFKLLLRESSAALRSWRSDEDSTKTEADQADTGSSPHGIDERGDVTGRRGLPLRR